MSLERLPRVVQLTLEQMGVLYRWGGKGVHIFDARAQGSLVPSPYYAFDCSGLHTWADWTAGGPDRRASWNTDRFWNGLPAVVEPFIGCYALYGGQAPTDVDHIMMVVGRVPDSSHYLVMGASGGGSQTLTQEVARASGAKVKIYRTHLYRNDFRGFRMPLCSLSQ